MRVIECDTCGTEYTTTNQLDNIVDLIRCVQCFKQDDKTVERIRYQKIKQTFSNAGEYKKVSIIPTGKTDKEILDENLISMTVRQKERRQFSKDMDIKEALEKNS
jgi:hypothetical protein